MIGIKCFDEMPDFCQSCPCFTTYELKKPTYNVGVQYCNATKLPVKEALECSSVTQAWLHTERPEWCPLCEVNEGPKREELDEDEWHRSIAGLSDL